MISNEEKAKRENDGALKQIAKLMLNSTYGKFGSKIERVNKYLVKDNDWEEYIKNATPYYLPLASTITDMARKALVLAVGDKGGDTVYCDTDSLVIKNFKPSDYPNIKIEDKETSGKLGYWGWEQGTLKGVSIPIKNETILVRRAKQYIWYKQGSFEPIKAVFASLWLERDLWPKLTPKTFITGIDEKGVEITCPMKQKTRTPTGIYLDSNFSKVITPAWEYPPLREQKIKTKNNYLEKIK